MINISEENLIFLQSKKILVATPCYGGMCTTGYLTSMLSLTKLCGELNIYLETLTMSNESLITRARNEMITHFYNSDFDYLMFIDADIQFNPSDVFNLVLKDLDMISGAYPMKDLNIEELVNKNFSLEEIKNALPIYVVNLKTKIQDEEIVIELKNGAIEALDVGTGFLLISKKAVREMISSYPELIYFSDEYVYNIEKGVREISSEKRYALFDTYIDHTRGAPRYLSEDYAFCRRWQAIGGKVYVDPQVVLNHIGTYVFRGKHLIDSSKLISVESETTNND